PCTKIVRLDRSISVNREFELLSRFFAPQAIARPLLRLPRDKVETANFKTILLREFGMPIRRITQTIAMPDPKRWRRLGIRSQPHLHIEAIAYTADGVAAYFQEFYVPPNNRKLLFDSDLRP